MGKKTREYVCATCLKTYFKAEHLIRHERVHTGEKPFSCPQCQRSFARQDSLARHQQRQGHDKRSTTAVSEGTATPNDEVNDQEQEQEEAIEPTNVQEADSAAQPPIVMDIVPQDPIDDFFLPLTWPDSEELLQSILTSTLPAWSENVELLPSQYLLADPTIILPPQELGSVWTTPNSTQNVETGTHAIRNVSQIISDLSANVTSEAESASLSTVFLDGCLHMFFDQFTPNLPVCHRPTFIFRDTTHPLLLNAIALGSLFMGQDVNIAKGEVLWKLAHTAVATSWHSLILHSGPSDPGPGIQLILTALLGQTYAMLSGTARLRSTAQIFHSLGFYWARQCDMYHSQPRLCPDINATEYTFEQWRTWAADEVRLRALLGHYLLDGLLPYFTGAPTCQRHASNSLPLPCSRELFQASTLEDWSAQLQLEQITTTTSFRQLLLSLFTNPDSLNQSHPRLSPFTIKIVLEGLESFVSESNCAEGSVVGNPSSTAIRHALGAVHTYITNSYHLDTGEQAELSIRWHIICIDNAVNFNSVCKALCAQFSVIQDVFGPVARDQRPIDLKKWIESPQARSALLHAAAVWDALSRLPLAHAQAVHIPICIFAAATIYAAFTIAGTAAISLPRKTNWASLMTIDLNDKVSIAQCEDNSLAQYLLCSSVVNNRSRDLNLLYDSNVFLMRLRQLQRPWSICASFESILQQWLSKCAA